MTQTPNSNPNPAPDNADSPDSTDSPDDTSAHTTDPTEAGEPHGTGHAVAPEDPVEAVEEELAAEEF